MVGAAAMKASAGVLVPITALGAERRSRALLGTLAGVIIFGSLWIAGFGPHIPAVRIQSSLVTPYSISNMTGLALGRGGADHAVRTAMEAILIGATIFCSAWAWRRREVLAPIGWLSLVSMMS